MRLPTLLLAFSLVLLVATPLAAAQSSDDEALPCKTILEMGVVPYSICMTKYASCVAWRLVWGPTAPCPL